MLCLQWLFGIPWLSTARIPLRSHCNAYTSELAWGSVLSQPIGTTPNIFIGYNKSCFLRICFAFWRILSGISSSNNRHLFVVYLLVDYLTFFHFSFVYAFQLINTNIYMYTSIYVKNINHFYIHWWYSITLFY